MYVLISAIMECLVACKLQLALVYISILHNQFIYLKTSTYVYVRIRKKPKQAKKRAVLRVQKTLRLNTVGGNRTHDLSLKRQKDMD